MVWTGRNEELTRHPIETFRKRGELTGAADEGVNTEIRYCGVTFSGY